MSEQKLYIGNLPYRTTEKDVREYFRGYGIIYSIVLIYDDCTGYTRGFGFIELEASAADAALRDLHGADFLGRRMIIRKAIGKEVTKKDTKKYAAEYDGRFDSPASENRIHNDICPKYEKSAGMDTDTRDFGDGCFQCVMSRACGRNQSGKFGTYGDFKRADFKGLNVRGKYYNIKRKKYGLYHAYKFTDDQIKYSGPSNTSPITEE